jgi:hypothetical protein
MTLFKHQKTFSRTQTIFVMTHNFFHVNIFLNSGLMHLNKFEAKIVPSSGLSRHVAEDTHVLKICLAGVKPLNIEGVTPATVLFDRGEGQQGREQWPRE